MNRLNVIYEGWGERWLLGLLLDAGGDTLFEYSSEALARGVQLSPYRHPLPRPGAQAAAYRGNQAFHGLPGFIADALPDGWGMLLMDRALRKAGRDPKAVSVLERLALIGDRAMGALSFEPAAGDLLPAETLQLAVLAREIAAFQSDAAADDEKRITDEKLRHLMQLGGSPQGARPKVLLDYNVASNTVTSGLPTDGAAVPWLVKFPVAGEHPEVCALEELYMRIARGGGMDAPPSRCFDLGARHSAFGVERFDRKVEGSRLLRIPLMSLSAYLEADHRQPTLDYQTVLLATLRLTGDQREVLKVFERCVFNVLFHNRDDHSRNFAFRLNEAGLWQLSPAFDLTFSAGPGGDHATSIAGHGTDIRREHLLGVARVAGIRDESAGQCIDHWVAQSTSLQKMAEELPIRRNTLTALVKSTAGRALLLEQAAQGV